jgi:hypothetical protein
MEEAGKPRSMTQILGSMQGVPWFPTLKISEFACRRLSLSVGVAFACWT